MGFFEWTSFVPWSALTAKRRAKGCQTRRLSGEDFVLRKKLSTDQALVLNVA